jgi:hypothetical protein
VLLAMIGSGLYLAELLRVRLGDLGSLGPDGELLADLEAEPLAVRFDHRRGVVASARQRATNLIRTGNQLNAELCRTTGEFFRSWGLPGARFTERTATSERGEG